MRLNDFVVLFLLVFFVVFAAISGFSYPNLSAMFGFGFLAIGCLVVALLMGQE